MVVPPRERAARAPRRPDVARLFQDRTLRLLWIVYCGASAADCLTTGRALALGLRERNPLGSWLYLHAGIVSLWVAKVGVLGVILLGLSLLPPRIAAGVTTALAVAMWVTVGANMVALANG